MTATGHDPAAMATRIGSRGVWSGTEGLDSEATAQLARDIEALGYGAWWVPETIGREVFVLASHLVDATESLVIATGIASIFNRHPGVMAQAQLTLAEQSAGRFLLGLGVSHSVMVSDIRGLDYSKPLSYMRDYLASMASAPYMGPAAPPERAVVLAALGPKMLELAATAADGAHPYCSTPDHTAVARAALGPDKMLCVEQKVVLCQDVGEARATARAALGPYLHLPNYYRNWFRHGFEESDLADNGSDRLIDAVVAWGSVDDLERRIAEHLDAGASHVCIQPIAPGEGEKALHGVPHREVLEALAPTTG